MLYTPSPISPKLKLPPSIFLNPFISIIYLFLFIIFPPSALPGTAAAPASLRRPEGRFRQQCFWRRLHAVTRQAALNSGFAQGRRSPSLSALLPAGRRRRKALPPQADAGLFTLSCSAGFGLGEPPRPALTSRLRTLCTACLTLFGGAPYSRACSR